MKSTKKLANYVSDMDRFLQDYDKKNPNLSKSQQKEVAKLQRIYRLRDNPNVGETPLKLWDEF